ncbi:iron chelate uptake ABC transporter family permease subunit [Nocardioides sp. AE5]|uniref:FecCD family ABC transporter permease n=1 Tax=Nocardioides sp. AE5 TaxID=2962573 RepID=UPI002881D143|nr:iron chelate uptake ABC transporter family permease subunit [Nocardioides sp. AE5]MDT0200888.1 iron chelate uptake ABC transporter family permease subunit [Nocardioides sp. AE5]
MSILKVRLRAGHVLRIDARTAVVCAVLAVLSLAVVLAALCYGSGWDRPGDVLAALRGEGPIRVSVTQWRMPRVVAALVFGAALGLAGAIFQNLTRNPLGAPDIIGLDAGAYTGVLLVFSLTVASEATITLAAIGGGLGAALVVYLLSAGGGFSGLRLIVIGIGIQAVLTAVNSWIILRSDLDIAISASVWQAGSLNGLDWVDIDAPVTVIVALSGLLVVLARPLHQAALGDELAVTSGITLPRLRILLVLIGVGLSATVTAVAGPIVFIALSAPQIGRRLAAAAGVPLLPAALTGAFLLTGSDLIAQSLLAPTMLPVGVVTTGVGGLYLLWLLTKEIRR